MPMCKGIATCYGTRLHIFAKNYKMRNGNRDGSHSLAEGEGFKPPIPEKGIPDFESSAIDHSANLPSKRTPTSYTRLAERKEGQFEIEPSE